MAIDASVRCIASEESGDLFAGPYVAEMEVARLEWPGAIPAANAEDVCVDDDDRPGVGVAPAHSSQPSLLLSAIGGLKNFIGDSEDAHLRLALIMSHLTHRHAGRAMVLPECRHRQRQRQHSCTSFGCAGELIGNFDRELFIESSSLRLHAS